MASCSNFMSLCVTVIKVARQQLKTNCHTIFHWKIWWYQLLIWRCQYAANQVLVGSTNGFWNYPQTFPTLELWGYTQRFLFLFTADNSASLSTSHSNWLYVQSSKSRAAFKLLSQAVCFHPYTAASITFCVYITMNASKEGLRQFVRLIVSRHSMW